jgi:hypothetical protein
MKKIQTQVKDCAVAILYANRMKLAGSNFRYNLNHFGEAMRKHLEKINEDGLEISVGTRKLVERAEKVLKEECEGKDCSYQKYSVPV